MLEAGEMGEDERPLVEVKLLPAPMAPVSWDWEDNPEREPGLDPGALLEAELAASSGPLETGLLLLAATAAAAAATAAALAALSSCGVAAAISAGLLLKPPLTVVAGGLLSSPEDGPVVMLLLMMASMIVAAVTVDVSPPDRLDISSLFTPEAPPDKTTGLAAAEFVAATTAACAVIAAIFTAELEVIVAAEDPPDDTEAGKSRSILSLSCIRYICFARSVRTCCTIWGVVDALETEDGGGPTRDVDTDDEGGNWPPPEADKALAYRSRWFLSISNC